MSKYTYTLLAALTFASLSPVTPAATPAQELRAVEPKVLAWRRDLHQNPELSNREFRTAKLVAEHLKSLGMTVETGIAHTGVVGVLDTGKPGPTIALRADMDALPVAERTDVPFASKAKTEFRGEQVGVMHACGHDSHTAMLMGTAEVLTKLKSQMRGKVVFVFQPAEEGAPDGEKGGASLMLEEGLFEKYKPEVMFGQHVFSTVNTGIIGYRSGPLMAGSNMWRIDVTGKQTHGARPWGGTDPIVIAAQIVTALQTIVSRQIDITENPAIVSVGIIKSGVRNNIIPETAELIGTIRTFTPAQLDQITASMSRMAENIAEASGATAKFTLDPRLNPVTYNDPKLTERVLPVLKRVAGADNVKQVPLVTGAEDFAYYAKKIPSFFFFVGVTPKGQNPYAAPSNHSPLFYLDESALPLGTRAMTELALDYLK
jgi:amidohydrolase